jgi:hypothetical protein
MLIRVWTELPSGKTTTLVAKIIQEDGPTMTIQYLSPTEDKDHGQVIYRYETQTYEIQDDSVTEYLGTDDESELGFKAIDNGFVKYDSDSDYEPSESDVESYDEESLAESDYYMDEE